MGGVQGMESSLLGQSIAGVFRAPGLMRILGAAYQHGALNKQILEDYVNGSISQKEIGKLYQKHVMASKTAQYEFAANLPKALGTLDPALTLRLQAEAWKKRAAKVGIDLNNQAALSQFLRVSGVQNPELLLSIGNQAGASMQATILSDIQYQNRLDQMAKNRFQPFKPIKSLINIYKKRGTQTLYYTSRMWAHVEQAMQRRRLESAGIYDITSEAIAAPGTEEYNARYWSVGDIIPPTYDIFSAEGATRTGIVRPFGPSTTRIRPSGFTYGTVALTQSKPPVYNPMLGGAEPYEPAGWENYSRAARAASMISLRERASLPGDVVSDIAHMAKIGRFGMVTGKLMHALATSQGGRLTPLGNFLIGAYDDWMKTSYYSMKADVMEDLDSIAQKHYHKQRFLDLDQKTQAAIIKEAQSQNQNIKQLDFVNSNDFSPLAVQDARKRYHKNLELYRKNLKHANVTKTSKKFLDWLIKNDQFSRVADYVAQMQTSQKDSISFRQGQAGLYKILGKLQPQYGEEIPAEAIQELQKAGTSSGLFTSLYNLGTYLERAEVGTKVRNYVRSDLLTKYAGDKKEKFLYENLESLASSNIPPTRWLTDLATSGDYKKLRHDRDAPALEKHLYWAADILHKLNAEKDNLSKNNFEVLKQLVGEAKKAGFVVKPVTVEEGGKTRQKITVASLQEAIWSQTIGELGGFGQQKQAVTGSETVGELANMKNVYEAISNLNESTKKLYEKVKDLSRR